MTTPDLTDLGLEVPSSGWPRLTDAGNAKWLVILHGQNLRYCWPWNCWLVWVGVCWKRDLAGLVYWNARDVAHKYYQMAAELDDKAAEFNNRAALEAEGTQSQSLAERGLKVKGLAKTFASWAKKCESEREINAMINLARSEEGITILPEDFDLHLHLLNFPNGTLDLRTGEYREHRRDDFLTELTAAPFIPGARRPEIEELLELAIPDPQVREWWLRTLARGLEGRPADLVTFLHGPGGTGKTTVTEGLLRALGDYAASVRLDTLTGRRFAGAAEPDLARLAGKRFVFVPEAEHAGDVLDLLKMVTGGNSTPTRNLYEKTSQFAPRFTLVLSANKRPALPDDDSGAQRRLREIAFLHRFPDNEAIREELINPETAGPAWLALLVAAHQRLRQEGMVPEPAELIRQTREFWRDMGSIEEFLQERTRPDPKSSAARPFSQLWASYVDWATEKGMAAPDRRRLPGQYLGSKTFSQRLAQRFKPVNVKGIGRCFQGVVLRDPDAVSQGGLAEEQSEADGAEKEPDD